MRDSRNSSNSSNKKQRRSASPVAPGLDKKQSQNITKSQSIESRILEHLPCAKMYEKSYMHRDAIDYVIATRVGFVITVSADGHVKFWKKTSDGVEFVKDYRAHLGAVTAYALSPDNQVFATASTDKMIKIFDVANFDMIGMVGAGCVPGALCWLQDPLDQSLCVAAADSESSAIYVFDPHAGDEPKRTITDVHRHPVSLLVYNPVCRCMVSADSSGIMEYWMVDNSKKLPPTVDFTLKSQTDLYEFKKSKSSPDTLSFSPNYERFVCTSTADAKIRVFNMASGKIYCEIDESISASRSHHHANDDVRLKLDDMEFGRRQAVESELRGASVGKRTNAIFDESGSYLIFSSLFGIKIVDLKSKRLVSVLGKPEPYRFVNIALMQGTAGLTTGSGTAGNSNLELTASSNPGNSSKSTVMPILFCTAYKRNRFFLFSRVEPDHQDSDENGSGGRDVFNERPTREEASLAVSSTRKRVARTAILRTTLGDIHMALYPEYAPKAVENFATHSQNGYYNGVIFHRVIKRFMIQTGDPLGDGTGGESIWSKPFADEITSELRHDQPCTVSMANAGPNTNGSQFFITTAESTPWLDGKHTIFGRVTQGADVVHLIEAVKTDKRDKPFDDISIMNIEIK